MKGTDDGTDDESEAEEVKEAAIATRENISKKSRSNVKDAVPVGVQSKEYHKCKAIPMVRNHICIFIS